MVELRHTHKAREREREREREKKPHKKRNKIVSKKRDFFTRSVDLGFRVLLIP